MALFSILVDLAARTSGLEQGIDRANRRIDGFSRDVRDVGKSIAAAFTFDKAKDKLVQFLKQIEQTVREGAELGDQLGKAAAKAGVGIEQFSALAFAAEQSNISLEALSKGLQNMQQGLLKTTAAGGQLSDELEDLGINIQSIKGLSAEKQFAKIASALSLIEDESEQTRIGLAIFGKTYDQIINIVKEGPEELKKNTDAAREFGLQLSEETLSNLQDANDAFDRLAASVKGLGLSIATSLAEPATGLANIATGFNKIVIEADSLSEKLNLVLGTLVKIQGVGVDLASGKTFSDIGLAIGKAIAEPDPIRNPRGGPSSRVGPRRVDSRFSVDDLAFDKKSFGDIGDVLDSGLKDVGRGSLDEEFEASLAGFSAKIEQFGTLRDDAIEGFIKRESEFQEQLVKDVSQGAEVQAKIAESSIEQSLDSIEQKYNDTTDFLRGVAEEFGRSVQSSLSDVFFNAGKGADKFADSVLNAFKRILADAAAKKTVDLIASLFNGGKTSTGASAKSSATSGFVSAIVGALFGGARAEGGPVSSGKAFLVGERGPELFMPGGSGQIVPNAALARAGGSNVNIVNNFDLRGSTKDSMDSFMQRLPAILRRNKEEVKAEIRQDINRQRFGLGKGG